jgi:hypothetical protein
MHDCFQIDNCDIIYIFMSTGIWLSMWLGNLVSFACVAILIGSKYADRDWQELLDRSFHRVNIQQQYEPIPDCQESVSRA